MSVENARLSPLLEVVQNPILPGYYRQVRFDEIFNPSFSPPTLGINMDEFDAHFVKCVLSLFFDKRESGVIYSPYISVIV